MFQHGLPLALSALLFLQWPGSGSGGPPSTQKVPSVVYRGDVRAPDKIRGQGGFLPENANWEAPVGFGLWKHTGSDKALAASPRRSPYVPTTIRTSVAEDFVRGSEGYIYHIQATPNFVDVLNSVGRENYGQVWEREFAALGGVRWDQVLGWTHLPRGANTPAPGRRYTKNRYDGLVANDAQPQLAGFPPGHAAWRKEPWRAYAADAARGVTLEDAAREFMDRWGRLVGWRGHAPLFDPPRLADEGAREAVEAAADAARADDAAQRLRDMAAAADKEARNKGEAARRLEEAIRAENTHEKLDGTAARQRASAAIWRLLLSPASAPAPGPQFLWLESRETKAQALERELAAVEGERALLGSRARALAREAARADKDAARVRQAAAQHGEAVLKAAAKEREEQARRQRDDDKRRDKAADARRREDELRKKAAEVKQRAVSSVEQLEGAAASPAWLRGALKGAGVLLAAVVPAVFATVAVAGPVGAGAAGAVAGAAGGLAGAGRLGLGAGELAQLPPLLDAAQALAVSQKQVQAALCEAANEVWVEGLLRTAPRVPSSAPAAGPAAALRRDVDEGPEERRWKAAALEPALRAAFEAAFAEGMKQAREQIQL